MLDDLELTDAHATAIVERGIEYDVYEGDEVPSNKKDRMEAAHDLVAFAIDAWTNDGVRPDSDDEETAEAGEQVKDMLEWAGVEIDEDNDVTFGELPEIEGEEGDDEETEGDEEDGDGEGPFDANDLIEGYDDAKVGEIIEIFDGGDLSADEIRMIQDYERENGERGKILNYEVEDDGEGDTEGDGDEQGEEPWEDYDSATAKDITDGLKALDDDDELEVEFAQYVKEYEEARETPKKRVLTWLDKWLDANAESDGDDEDNGDDEESGEELEEPFEGYDGASAADIRNAVQEALDSDEGLDTSEVQAIIEYEEARDKPRSSLLKYLNGLLEGDDDDTEGGDDEEEQEEKPAAKSKSKGRKSKKSADEDIDLDDDEIEAMLPAGLAKVHVKSKMDEARKEIEEQGLSLPGAYEGDEPELPNDISGVDHNTLSDLLAQFQNAHSTAITQAAQAHIWFNTYSEIAEYLENQNVLDSDQSNDTKRKAEARSEPRVVFFRAKTVYWKNEHERWSRLATTYDKKGAVVSRVGGFVEGDNAQEDRRASKPSTRGSAKGATKKDTEDDKPAAKAKPGVKKPGVKKSAAKRASKPTVKRK